MDIKSVIKKLEVSASGCSPLTGEVIDKESLLNNRNVLRALQVAINEISNKSNFTIKNILIDNDVIRNVIV